MSIAANVERFPMRHSAVVWLLRHTGEWMVIAREHGWAHGDYAAALADAEWLSANLELPIRVAT